MRARVEADSPGYASPDELERDLKVVADSLDAVGAAHARRALVEPLLAQVRAHGFHGYRLDVREDAAVHARALHDLTTAVGLGELDGAAIRRELLGRRPLHTPHVAFTGPTDGTLEVFRVMRAIQDEIGVAAASTYIVSRTRSADDLLRVLLLAGEGGLVDLSREPALSRLDIVPLFETLEDLERAPLVVRSLLGDPIWQRHLAARGQHQEVMLGYSDSAKDAGLFPSAWALYRVQEEVARACADAHVAWTLFHGRGGTVGRGGGSPVARALTALPPGTVHGGIKITEQGEIVSQNFGLLAVAERSLELMLSGVLLHRFEDWRTGLEPGEEARFREVMDRLAAEALPGYRTLVYGSGDLFKLFVQTTPVRELAGDLALFDHLENEFRRTIAALLRIRESDYLMRDNPMLQTAIGLRNPYVDPLSLLQVTLLQRKRDGDPAPGPVSAGLASTLNGIAQGLRNTG